MFCASLHYKVIPFLTAFPVDNPSRAKGTRYYSIHQEEIHFSYEKKEKKGTRSSLFPLRFFSSHLFNPFFVLSSLAEEN